MERVYVWDEDTLFAVDFLGNETEDETGPIMPIGWTAQQARNPNE